ncbi:alpha/beta fold hydrolase [Streptomyces sp. NPDC005795]|uniref:thioesterase II family protein n=1 Tax=Streptomyces sp. NPDC005795 TaxID=3154677 RepID=UPI0034046719
MAMSAPSWFLSRETDLASPVPRIYCFHHAGGNPRAFLALQPGLGAHARVVPVCMPGRDHRADVPRPASVDEFAEGAAAAIAEHADDQPFYLLGHSLGALVAFETARRLRHVDTLARLIVSGSNAPSRVPSARTVQTARLEGREFAEAMTYFGGMPPEAIQDDDLRRLLLPGLQEDFQLSAAYRYEPAEPLGVGISLVNGLDDPHVKAPGLEPWRRECEGEPQYHWAPGGHFYFMDEPSALTDVLLPLVHDGDRPVASAGHHTELI